MLPIFWLEVVLAALPFHALKIHFVDFQIVYVKDLPGEGEVEGLCFSDSQSRSLEYSVPPAAVEYSLQ